jgi:ribulose-phosphate 3-epimerase
MTGIALSAATPLKSIEKYLDLVDYVLVMTIKPGPAGQKLIKAAAKKIKTLRKKYPDLIIEVDGGINDKNAGELIEFGANILVSSNYVWKSKDPKLAVDLLRNA